MTLKLTMRKDWCCRSIPLASTMLWCAKSNWSSSGISHHNNAGRFVNGCGLHVSGMTLRDLRIGLTQLLDIGAITLPIIPKVRVALKPADHYIAKYFFDTSKGRNVVTRVEGSCSCGNA